MKEMARTAKLFLTCAVSLPFIASFAWSQSVSAVSTNGRGDIAAIVLGHAAVSFVMGFPSSHVNRELYLLTGDICSRQTDYCPVTRWIRAREEKLLWLLSSLRKSIASRWKKDRCKPPFPALRN
jgi:hypothetical protein